MRSPLLHSILPMCHNCREKATNEVLHSHNINTCLHVLMLLVSNSLPEVPDRLLSIHNINTSLLVLILCRSKTLSQTSDRLLCIHDINTCLQVLMSQFSDLNLLVARHQCLHDAPGQQISHGTIAEDDHIARRLAFEAEEREVGTLLG